MMNTQKEFNTLKTCLFLCLAYLFSFTAQGQALNLLVSEGSGVLLGDLSPAKVGQQVVLERLVGNESQVWRFDLEAQHWHDLDIINPIEILPFNGGVLVIHGGHSGTQLTHWDPVSNGVNTLSSFADDYVLGQGSVFLFQNQIYVGRYDGLQIHAVDADAMGHEALTHKHQGVCEWDNGDRVIVGEGERHGLVGLGSWSEYDVFAYSDAGVATSTIVFDDELRDTPTWLLKKRGDYCLIYDVYPGEGFMEYTLVDVVSPSKSNSDAALNFLAPLNENAGRVTHHFDVLMLDDFVYATRQDKIFKVDVNTWQTVKEVHVPLPIGQGSWEVSNYGDPWENDINQRAMLFSNGDQIVLNNGHFTAVFDPDLQIMAAPKWSPQGGTLSNSQSIITTEDLVAFMISRQEKGELAGHEMAVSTSGQNGKAGLAVYRPNGLNLFYGDNRLAFGPNERFKQQSQGRLVQATDRYTGRKGIYQLSNTPAIGQFISGAWYDSELANQGLAIHQGKRTDGSDYLFLTAYLFKDGAPLWLAGVGEIPAHNAESITFDLFEFDGLNFLQPNQAAIQSSFGSIELRLSDCNTLDIELDDGNTTHALNMYRANDTTYQELCQ